MIRNFPKHGSADPDPPAADVAAGEGGTAARAGAGASRASCTQEAIRSVCATVGRSALRRRDALVPFCALCPGDPGPRCTPLARDRSAQCPPLGGGASGLQPCEFLRRCLSGSAARAAAQLHGAIDTLRIGTGLVYPISGGVSDSARGNGGVGRERDAPSAARRRNRDPFSRGHP